MGLTRASLLALAACGASPPPASPPPIAPTTSEATPAVDDHAMPATPTCPDHAGAAGMPAPLWTQRLDSIDPLPCDGTTTAGVHGFVKDKRGTPVACANVTVTSLDGSELGTALTDAAGCYAISVPAPGRADVSITFGSSRGSLVVAIPASGLARFDGTLER